MPAPHEDSRDLRRLTLPSRVLRGLPGIVLGLVWIVAVGTGLGVLLGYEHRAGVAADPPGRWPARSRLERTGDRATLVMLIHPGCPCSRASVAELDRLMAGASGLVTAHVLVFKPREFADDWERTELWRSAAAIPGVHVQRDDDGVEAGIFHASTSGQVVLYDARGGLLFSGGITASRGHAGDNAGRDAIVALLTRHAPAGAHTPVFGCSLHDPDREPGVTRRTGVL